MITHLLVGLQNNSFKLTLSKNLPSIRQKYRYLCDSNDLKDNDNENNLLIDSDESSKPSSKPRVIRFGFDSARDSWKYSRGGIRNPNENPHSSCSSDLISLPIFPIEGHIFPCFEKLVKKNDYLMNIIKTIPPKTPRIGLFTVKDGATFDPTKAKDLTALYSVGVLASYETWPHTPNESPYIILRSHKRLNRLLDNISTPLTTHNSQLYADCRRVKEVKFEKTPEIKSLCYQIIDVIRRLQHIFPFNSVSDELNTRILNPIYWSYSASDFTLPYTTARLQTILEENDIVMRLKLTSQILSEELQFYHIATQLNQRIKETESRDNYINHLRKMKHCIDSTIENVSQPESFKIGEGAGKFGRAGVTQPKYESSFELKIRNRLKNLVLPPNIASTIEEELTRLSNCDKSSVEGGTVQAYLDQLTLIPWGVFKGSLDVQLARALEVLNEDHYGLEEVKDTIIEHLAVASRIDKAKGRIICFVGEPGVGKTSVVKSIARALNRDYVRVSFGGVDDSSEIKGHRRTYVSAFPGKIIKGLQLAKSMDPVFCVDEIDKLCKSYRGDPSGPLLEAFDPEQNVNFTDHYIDLPCDISRVMFICTANDTSHISRPLLDRMEVIHLSGYTSEEKLEIVNNYVIPSILKEFDMTSMYSKRIVIDQNVIKKLTNEYFLEPGIRNTKKCIEKIFRKTLKEISINNTEIININEDNLSKYAGYPDHRIRKPSKENYQIGVVTGLSCQEGFVTGFPMQIECDLVAKEKSSSKDMSVTGMAGQSLSESSVVAYTVAKRMVSALDPTNNELSKNTVRLHFLDGATRKDGPSAGVGIFCAVLSQALRIPVSPDLAMSGEISLKGKIMAVGGIKKKITGALRTGICNVMISEDNRHDFESLHEEIKSKINIHYVNNVEEVLKIVFPSLALNENITNEKINKNENVQSEII